MDKWRGAPLTKVPYIQLVRNKKWFRASECFNSQLVVVLQMREAMKNAIAYERVSTAGQGRSGLGLKATFDKLG